MILLVAAFLTGMAILGGVTIAGLYLYLRHPWSPSQHDRRAYPGSDDISLKKSLRLTGTTLPEGAVNVRYYVQGNMMGTLLQLSYQVPCHDVPAITAEANTTIPIAVDSLENNALRFAKRHGWSPEHGTTVAFSDDQTWNTVIMVQTPATGDCSVYLRAFT
ncbi:hypothetical protein [Streptomyces sp. SID3343]|uniref:hypothetical protein n=1 Tax=Streptomyces sp. SID3343 TaxID=2690260 RepID=UPI001368BE5C|nr:hypothetical protein [Streptomyces sp. SID3343]MYW04137.1 hypothetical protein [Streptomyces sp. SID3343]